MKVEISSKLYKKFQRLEDTEDLNEIETLDYFQEKKRFLIEYKNKHKRTSFKNI